MSTCESMIAVLVYFALVRPLFGAPRGNRTPNPLIKSQLLCQLS